MDETGRFWRGLPEKTLDAKGTRYTGGNKEKQRLTWPFAEGEKGNPLLLARPSSRDALKTYGHQAGHTAVSISHKA